jgi:hypothetical protein
MERKTLYVTSQEAAALHTVCESEARANFRMANKMRGLPVIARTFVVEAATFLHVKQQLETLYPEFGNDPEGVAGGLVNTDTTDTTSD